MSPIQLVHQNDPARNSYHTLGSQLVDVYKIEQKLNMKKRS